jgi:REP element-mobilizing transposase RayT
MSEGYQIRDQGGPHFLTFTVTDWVDVFTRKIYKDLVIESLQFCQDNKGLDMYAYVIMSNHIHLIIGSKLGKLSELVRDLKSYLAKIIINKIQEGPESRSDWMLKRFEFAARSNSRNSGYQFWRYGNHPEEVFSEKFLWTKVNYIHMNPVRAGIVSKASEYLYSSASNYVHGKGLISFELPSNPIIDVLGKDRFNFEIDEW